MLDPSYMPRWLQMLFPLLQWRCSSKEKRIYLTFDDGPTPGVTDRILDILTLYEAKATFFCLGAQAESSPVLLRRIQEEGHAIGNHGFAHLNGWKSGLAEYLEDVRRGQETLTSILTNRPKMFRPPYGRLTPAQWWRLRRDYCVVMWDINSQDYRDDLSPMTLMDQTIQRTQAGSIVLCHDSELAASRSLAILPELLKHFCERGYEFSKLQCRNG